jgi:cytochrome c5
VTDLLSEARALTAQHDPRLAGAWQRAVALLARQALETAVAETLRTRAPGAERVSARAQLLCLPTYAPTEPAHHARYLWSALSRACHHHPYELAPTVAELNAWIEGVERVTERIAVRTTDVVED